MGILLEKKYLYLQEFSDVMNIPPDSLVKAFEIEMIFHQEITTEQSFEKRKKLYQDVYNQVHPIYSKHTKKADNEKNIKDKIVNLFRKELEGKSILDVGCGNGQFLLSVQKNIKHKRLVGVDTYIQPYEKSSSIEFISKNVVDFELDSKFDVVFSDNLLEHLSLLDLDTHLSSITSCMKKDSAFILIAPNRYFGPSDITRIVDFTYSGKTESQGTHLNELTYNEIIPVLKKHGFVDFKTVLPIPKFKYLVPSIRISPAWIEFIESNPFLLKLWRLPKFKRKCVVKFDVTLICRR